jgi:3-oxoacyl-[acyl-carrier protein] reductase
MVPHDISLPDAKLHIQKLTAQFHRLSEPALLEIRALKGGRAISRRFDPLNDLAVNSEYDRLYDINVRSIFHMPRAVVPIMRTQGAGVILNIGSTAGIRPRPGLTWYNSTKGAVNLLSKSMAVELAPDGIRVNCIAPVIGATALLESFMGLPDTPENREKFIATIPMGRMSEPQDIANACLYLASDEAEFITGIVLEVDGGRTI